jgi:hypothetical protein
VLSSVEKNLSSVDELKEGFVLKKVD